MVSRPAPELTTPAVNQTPWSIDFKTSGGFAGIGKGSISVDSAGKFKCSHIDRGQTVSGASGTLNRRQLQPITDAVAQLNPKGWNQTGLNVAAADAFGYRVEFHPDENHGVAAQWYDNTADQLPADLKRLDTVIEETMKTACVSPR